MEALETPRLTLRPFRPEDAEAVIGYGGLELEELGGQREVTLGYRLARAKWGLGKAILLEGYSHPDHLYVAR